MKKGKHKAFVTDFEKMFHPKTLAIVGVSAEGGSVGFGNGILLATLVANFFALQMRMILNIIQSPLC